MTGDDQDEWTEDDGETGRCEVCGESVAGRLSIALGLFAVSTVRGDVYVREPDIEPGDCDRLVKLLEGASVVHADCMSHFLDGFVAEAGFRDERGELEEM